MENGRGNFKRVSKEQMINIKKLNILFSKLPSLFEKDIEIDLLYLDSFKIPKDKLQRSYFQYKCQKFGKHFYIYVSGRRD